MSAALHGPAIRAYVLAGRAVLTAHNPATGGRFTYRVRASKDGAVWFVDLLCGPSNEHDYRYIGIVRRADERFVPARGTSPDAPGVRAWAWLWQRVRAGQEPAPAEVLHEGCCGRCGRRLTVPESIETGLGPECAKRGAA